MTKTTREEELRMTLGNFATCRDSIGEDEEEFDARIGMAFGGRDKSKKQIDDLTDRAVSDIKHLLEKEREAGREEILSLARGMSDEKGLKTSEEILRFEKIL